MISDRELKAAAAKHELTHKNCPSYCHRCPDMDGHVMPFCYGTINNDDPDSLSGCYCHVEMECARNAAHDLADHYARQIPEELRAALFKFANSPVPGRRSKVVSLRAAGVEVEDDAEVSSK